MDELTPFYSIDSGEKFDSLFSDRYASFKNLKMKNKSSDLDYSCHIVKQQLDKLRNNKKWLNKLRINRDKFTNFESMIDMWFQSDKLVYSSIQELEDQLDDGLSDIRESIGKKPTAQLLNELKLFPSGAENEFKEISSIRVELGRISARLM